MLKNKKITYLLILLVILIWSVIFYRIYTNFSGKEQKVENLQPTVAGIENDIQDSVFTLSLNYPDPFLKGMEKIYDRVTQEETPVNVNYHSISWPAIEYRGLLTSRDNNSTGLLKIQSADFLVKQGNEYASVKIRQMTSDSIFLEYKKEMRWVSIIKTVNQ